MINFREPQVSDKKWVYGILKQSGYMGADCIFGSIYLWKDSYKGKICNFDNLLLRLYEKDGLGYTFPIGDGDINLAIDAMVSDSKDRGRLFKMIGLTKSMVEYLNSIMPGKFVFYDTRDSYDYIYKVTDLAYLKGKKYHSKRNHISKFNRLYDYKYEDIIYDNISECMGFIDNWFLEFSKDKADNIASEKRAIELAFDNYDSLELKGGVIKVGDKIVALTIGEEINNKIFDIHFEKALPQYEGSYNVINNEFVRRNLMEYEYVNREEDMGLEGLRKSKLSYCPEILLEKYDAVLK